MNLRPVKIPVHTLQSHLKFALHTSTETTPLSNASTLYVPACNYVKTDSAAMVASHKKFPVSFHQSLETVNLKKLERVLNVSFRRQLKASSYWDRLASSVALIIVAGKNYEGATIITKEYADNLPVPFYYLDKFAVEPSAQGYGLADIMWRELTMSYEDTFWRSRSENPVNKWYFRHSELSFKLNLSSKSNPQIMKQWVCFAVGPKKLENMAYYNEICRKIPESFK